jgi:hypothetical protein
LVLQQFLRFGETRAITQQLLMHGLGDLRHLPRSDSDFKKMVEKSIAKGLSTNKTPEESGRSGNKYPPNNSSSAISAHHKLRNPTASSPTNITSPLLPPPPHMGGGKFPSLIPPQPPHSGTTPHSSMNFLALLSFVVD